MSGKFIFRFSSQDKRRRLPGKIIVAQNPTETPAHVLLKALAYVLFHRDRIQLETRLQDDNIAYKPDVVQVDYELRARLWVECGECSVDKLDRLAVKVPDAELWVVKRSLAEAEHLWQAMRKADLRTNRYRLIGFDPAAFDELLGLLQTRNDLAWIRGGFDPPLMQLDFNGLWFDTTFTVLLF